LNEPDGIHKPVLTDKIDEILRYGPDAVVIDATVGQAGHAKRLASRLGPEGRLIGLDVDEQSLAISRSRLADAACAISLVRENFNHLDEVMKELGVPGADVIIADLGVSSGQLAAADRGFSFQLDGPLDMRMDGRTETTAADLVNDLSEEDLANVIYQYGEERHSRRIARAIVERRRSERLERTGQLVEAIERGLGIRGGGRRGRLHPATKTFQALRIAVNDELSSLSHLMETAPELLREGGQVAIISFHSLEDRLVKNNFRENGRLGRYQILTRKPIIADEAERRENPRSRSAKLRVAKKMEPPMNADKEIKKF
jgi:16S rRNA (cytosine1402-N4)-methyltransferase